MEDGSLNGGREGLSGASAASVPAKIYEPLTLI